MISRLPYSIQPTPTASISILIGLGGDSGGLEGDSEGEGSGGEVSVGEASGGEEGGGEKSDGGPSGGGDEVEGREKVEEWELWVEEGG